MVGSKSSSVSTYLVYFSLPIYAICVWDGKDCGLAERVDAFVNQSIKKYESRLVTALACGNQRKSVMFLPFFGAKTTGADHSVCAGSLLFGTTFFQLRYFQTIGSQVQHGIELSGQAVSSHQQGWYDVLLRLFDQSFYLKSIKIRLAWL